MFLETSYLKYLPSIGDYDFSAFKLDVRTYLGLGAKERVLAFQSVIKSTSGDVPFYRLSEIGGKRLFRVYPDHINIWIIIVHMFRLLSDLCYGGVLDVKFLPA